MAFALDYPELEGLYSMAGGKFRLTVLLQRRVNELVGGMPRLVKVGQEFEKDFIYIAVEELKRGLIKLAEDNETILKTASK
ncbi:MAG: DNA-directed RNA polymerase subunit omega [Planctomycetes bacterium]|nr:DNA-directed RNA polymerase subunit omega [Planctomycetota bacterium]